MNPIYQYVLYDNPQADPLQLSFIEVVNRQNVSVGGFFTNAYLKIDGRRIKLGRYRVGTLAEALYILNNRTKNRIALAPRILKQLSPLQFICERITI